MVGATTSPTTAASAPNSSAGLEWEERHEGDERQPMLFAVPRAVSLWRSGGFAVSRA